MDSDLMMVGIGLAALMIGLFAWLRTDISRMGERLDKRIDDLRQEMKQDIAAVDKRLTDLDGRLRAVEHGLAKLEGLLEGLREAIAGRKDAA